MKRIPYAPHVGQLQHGNVFESPPSPCPGCGVELRRISGVDRSPGPGDISICADCGALMRITYELTVRALTAEELALLKAQPAWDTLLQAQEQIAKRLDEPRLQRIEQGLKALQEGGAEIDLPDEEDLKCP